ncbi:hydroxyproline-rich glycoprotein family protein [Senna tora]|uniref:Hydroxyproline-rich glycoprotein family protein n=1 Tax=Senna tora TaxID=362788 RepID=A0A834TC58_9FABA|nr:hydroxyproline-rich glycoprotein family protein [Senna tora]
MKSSLSLLRRISLHKSVGKEKTDFQPLEKLDELAQAAKDVQEMRNCYDSLLSAAAATTNSAYEFSESLREMGTCLLEKTSVNDDEESGKILGMLGRVQLELQKLIDNYRSHIIVTITNPSESLLNELRTVEDMKRQCDEKRDVYEYMIAQQKDKGRSKSGKGENITSQQLQAAHDEYREEATLCAFSGLEEDDTENNYDANEGGELSFDYRLNKQGPDAFSNSHNATEVEESSHSYLWASTSETAETNLDKNQIDLRVSTKEPRVSSYSAPIIAEKKFDPAEKVRQLLTSSSTKSNAYVLPTPVDIRETSTAKTSGSAPRISASGRSQNLWHSSPLDEKKNEKQFDDGKLSESTVLRVHSGLKESNSDNTSTQIDVCNNSDTKKFQRQASSGPLISKPLSVKHALSAGSMGSTEIPPLVSGVLSRLPMPQLSCPKASPSPSPPLVSSPRINELHELPRPPNSQSIRPMKSYQIGHSAPLALRNLEPSITNKFPSGASCTASPLPTPPLIVSRSFSIPSSGQRAMTLPVAKLLDAPKVPERTEEVASPPLTPISLSNIKRVPSISELPTHSSEIQDVACFRFSETNMGRD